MKFRLGINYWPATSAMYWWSHFDRAEVETDFARIRGANLDSVRIFLLWEHFQPSEGRVDERALGQLTSVADIAARHGLSLIVTLFTGHMSGVNWIPAWALAPRAPANQRFRTIAGGRAVHVGPRNWYADTGVAASQALLARSVAQALGNHAALWAYDLGNENSNCVMPPARDAARRWLAQQTEAIRSVDRRHPITLGLHMEDLEQDRNLWPHDAASVCDFLCMHVYPMYADWSRGATDVMTVPFLLQLTQWLGGADVLLEEFGAPTRSPDDPQGAGMALLDEQTAADYIAAALSQAVDAAAMGGLVWCYADYRRDLWRHPPLDEAPHERHFGAWRADYSEKPAVESLRSYKRPPEAQPYAPPDWIDLARDRFYDAPADNVRALYRKFLEANA